MEVILTQDVENLGKYGEVKNVKDGYARNYLIPNGSAVLATTKEKERVEKEKEIYMKKREGNLQGIEKKKNDIEKIKLEFKVKMTNDKMFGSITNNDISKTIKDKSGIFIDKKNIEINPIHEVGKYKAKIKLGEGVKAKILIDVKKEGA